ncbi:MAG TPA: VOC family protein [Solirubrobacteraceae bacterium]|nr:VOC family protein [Solirubrobacteraceae bacterium]
MGRRTEHPPGAFSWVELSTTDAGAAKAFYTGLFGWEADDNPIPGGGVYTMLRVGGAAVAALYRQMQEGAPANWLSYVTVESADAAAARAKELGGTLVSEPFDVMDVGRMAVVQDPQGAVFAVWEPRAAIGAELVNDPGSLTMNQLNAADPEAARAFYEGLFGWRFEPVSQDPPYWSVLNGERLNAGMMALPPGAPAPPHWLAYFTVEDLDAAAGRIGELGGAVLVAPTDIPAGRFLVATDPQGAVFALFAGEVDD